MNFEINGEYIELIKLLKATGVVDSGSTAKLVVDDSLVKVNGIIELRRRYKVRKGDVVEFEDNLINIC